MMSKARPLRGTVYKKMILSFLSFVLLIALLNGIIGYIFGRTYEEQVHADSQAALSRLGEQLDERVFQQAHALYADLISNTVLYPEVFNFLQGDSFDSLSYYRLYVSLRAALARAPEVFLSVALYNRTEDAVVSSASGVKWIVSQKEEKYTGWVQTVLETNDRLFWRYTAAQEAEPQKVQTDVSMYATYPTNALGPDCRGAVRIQLNLSAISGILREFRTQQFACYLIDRAGNIISGGGDALDFCALFGDRLASAGTENRVDVCELNHEKTVVVSQPYQQDYILVSVTSLGSFYEKTNTARNTVNLIGLVVMLLGLLLAAVLSNRLYRPLRQLVEPAEKRYGGSAGTLQAHDEYAYIRALMEDLFSKASTAEAVLDQNFQLIRNGLLQSLLFDASVDERASRERIDFLHLELPYAGYCVVRLKIPARSFEALGTQRKDLVLYGLLNGFGEYRNGELRLYGVKSAPDTLTMLVNLTEEAWKRHGVWMRELSQVCIQYSGIRPQMCLSERVSSLREITLANQETERIEPYFYFMTAPDYLLTSQIPALQDEEARVIPTELLEDFAEHLQAYQEKEARQDIRRLIDACRTGRYSAQHCNQRILSMLFMFSRFVRSAKIGRNDPFYEKIHSDYLKCWDADRLEEWLCGVVAYFLQLLQQNASGNYSAMMNEIEEYIVRHLAEPISLELLADTFRLSPNYLSRLFKEETGVNYTDFVNNAKLTRAARQLTETSKKIDEIAEETGFNSSAYFIKKFKQKYGVTPKKYRMDATMSDREVQ